MSAPRIVATGWAVERNGVVVNVVVNPGTTEESAWMRAVWHPTPNEIAWHKSHGAHAFRVEVREIEE